MEKKERGVQEKGGAFGSSWEQIHGDFKCFRFAFGPSWATRNGTRGWRTKFGPLKCLEDRESTRFRATGKEQSIKGMRTSEFCLHPAGDTPTSCRLFDAIQSLCIPVIVSDNIELPFEGTIDYTKFSVFVAVSEALQPNWLVNHLKSYTDVQKSNFRNKIGGVQSVFEYDNGYPGGIGPIPLDGAVNHIWQKVHQKLPMIKAAIVREKRKPLNVSIPRRCHCT